MRLSEIGLDGKGLCDQFHCNVVFTLLMGNHTEQMQRDRLIGVSLQYLLIYAFSFGQFTRAVMLQGKA